MVNQNALIGSCSVTFDNASDYLANGLLSDFIIRSTCNSRDTLLAEALIYRLRGHYVGLRRKSGPIRYIRADIVRVGFLPAETCFCRTCGLNQFKPV